MSESVKVPFDLIWRTNDVFRKWFCFWRIESNACFFSIVIFWTRWNIHITFYVEQGKFKPSFGREFWSNQIFLKLFSLQNCSINVYLFLNNVPWLAQTVHENLVEFGDTKPLSLPMNNDLKKYFGFGFLQLTLDCFPMRLWACSNKFIKFSVKFGGDKTSFWCEFAEERNFQKAIGFQQYETNVRLFSNMVFGLGQTFVWIIYSSLGIGTTFSWTHGLA